MTKKIFAASLSLLLACAAVRAAEPTAQESAKAKVEELCKATVKLDFEKIADLTNPAVIKMMGGREKMISTLDATMKQVKEAGFEIVSMTVGEASDTFATDKELYIVVKDTGVMNTPKGKMTQKSYVLGVSTDKGKSWTFVDGSMGREMIEKVLTDLPKDLKLPAPEAPVMTE